MTLDGVAIQQGSVTFQPIDGTQGPVAGGAIAKGRYGIAAANGPVVGRNRVEICAPGKSGRKVRVPMGEPGEMTDEILEVVPRRYNIQSTLTREVKLGENVMDFDLTTR